MSGRAFHSADMKQAFELAANLGLTIRLEGGAIVASPAGLDQTIQKRTPTSVEEWRRKRNEGKTRGRP
jgi:hypothetical protein